MPCRSESSTVDVLSEDRTAEYLGDQGANESEDELHCLTVAQLDGLRTSPAVIQAARDPALQRVICAIDSATDRQATLAAHMYDPHFVDFVNTLLEAVGAQQDPDILRERKITRAKEELRKLSNAD